MKQVLLLIFLFSITSYAQNQVYNIQKSKGNLYEYAEFANAGHLDLSISEIIKNKTLNYRSLKSDNYSVGFTSDNYWVRFKLKNTNSKPETYYLETARPITDVAELYQISNIETKHFKSGDNIPFKNKQVKHRSTIFKITLPPNKIQQIYINLKSDGETINIPLNLYNESSFWMVNYNQQLFLGLFYGLLFLAGIIYLFFYSSLKEKAFLYYSVYVFSICFMQAALDGLMHEYFFSSASYLNSRLVLITALFSNFFLLKYCEHFLQVSKYSKKYKKLYHIAYCIIGVLFSLLFINTKTLEIAYPISNLNGLFSLILILTTIFMMRFKGIKIDPYFSFGILFLVIGLLGFVMNNLSLLPNNFYTLNSAKFGSGFEVIFLSLSMTNLIRKLRIDKEKSQEEALAKSEEISELKTYFMSNMSHELRTPINAIMGIAEDELEKQNNKEANEAFEIIKNASLSLLSNVNDIIDFEKIENNKLSLSFEEFNPALKLKQISDNWDVEAKKKGLHYKLDLDNKIPETILADGKRFTQIINNVLANAVKFTEKGSIHFKVLCTDQPNDICRFSLIITDTGVGMNERSKNNVFDSFNQMRLNHKRTHGGIGLGLTIVNHIVNLFNGEIKIESKCNEGTSVYIDLNLKVVSSEKKSIKHMLKTNDDPIHVLVVEDNKMNQLVLCKILKTKNNISYSIANNGQEAIDALQVKAFNIILMDLQMPIMDGYEATEIIKSGSLGEVIENTPIIAVTADATNETKQRVLNMGMIDYITKPVSKNLLLEKIFNYSSANSDILKTG